MHTWSKMRKTLEDEYLAESLRGRLTYFVTAYHGTHDKDEGRVAVRLDGAEILKSNYFDRFGTGLWSSYQKRTESGDPDAWRHAQYDMLENGEFYQADFYRAFQEFDNQSIAESRISENPLVRMLALLDRRTGKRSLEQLRQRMREEPQWLQMIYYLRLEAEGMNQAKSIQKKGEGVPSGLSSGRYEGQRNDERGERSIRHAYEPRQVCFAAKAGAVSPAVFRSVRIPVPARERIVFGTVRIVQSLREQFVPVRREFQLRTVRQQRRIQRSGRLVQ